MFFAKKSFLLASSAINSQCFQVCRRRRQQGSIAKPRLLMHLVELASSSWRTLDTAEWNSAGVLVAIAAFKELLSLSPARCVKLDYGHVGCSADVMELADFRCSGLHECQIRIPDALFGRAKPCPDDLKPYLEASYTCIKGRRSIPQLH